MAGIQTNRTASGVVLPVEVSSQIWQDAQAASVVMQKATRIDLPGEGLQVPMITGDPIATWVGETDEIATGDSTFGSKTLQAQKVGIIELFSNEFKRDLPTLYSALAERLPGTIATAFDKKVFHTAGSSTFDSLVGSTGLILDSTNTYDDAVAIDSAIYEANGVTDGWVVAPKARRVLLSAKDSTGAPLLLNSITGDRNVPSILGADLSYSQAVYKADEAGDGVGAAGGEVLGYAGQWAGNAFWGNVSGIEVSISEEATINKGGTQINLFQRDMFALKVTAWLGFGVRHPNRFVKVLSGVNAIA